MFTSTSSARQPTQRAPDKENSDDDSEEESEDLNKSMVMGLEDRTKRRHHRKKEAVPLWDPETQPRPIPLEKKGWRSRCKEGIRQWGMPMLILLSMLEALVESMPVEAMKDWMSEDVILEVECFISLVFSIDLLKRLNNTRKGKDQDDYEHSLLFVDFMAIVPLPLQVAMFVMGVKTRSLRALPALKVLRVLKSGRHYHILFILQESVSRSIPPLAASAFFLVNLGMAFAAATYLCEWDHPTAFESIPNCMWFNLVTMTTVGYGDFVPESDTGRFLVSLVILCGLCFMSMPLAVVGNNFVDVWTNKDRITVAKKMWKIMVAVEGGGTASDVMHKAFAHLDKDNSGEVTVFEFAEGLHEIGIRLDRKELWTLWQSLDGDGSGMIDYHEFSNFLITYGASDGGQHTTDEGEGQKIGLDMMASVVNCEYLLGPATDQVVTQLVKSSKLAKLQDPSRVLRVVQDAFIAATASDCGEKLTQSELGSGLTTLGITLSEVQLAVLFSKLDPPNCGKLELFEVCSFFTAQMQLYKKATIKDPTPRQGKKELHKDVANLSKLIKELRKIIGGANTHSQTLDATSRSTIPGATMRTGIPQPTQEEMMALRGEVERLKALVDKKKEEKRRLKTKLETANATIQSLQHGIIRTQLASQRGEAEETPVSEETPVARPTAVPALSVLLEESAQETPVGQKAGFSSASKSALSYIPGLTSRRPSPAKHKTMNRKSSV